MSKNKVRNLFPKNNKNVIPLNTANGNIQIDISTLPDMHCIKCGEEYFINVTKIKKLSKHISPDGREGNVNINMLRCSKCGWLFNPKEWQDTQDAFDEIEKKVLEDIQLEKVEPKKEESIEDTIGRKLMCRKCGEFYNEGEDHICKPI